MWNFAVTCEGFHLHSAAAAVLLPLVGGHPTHGRTGVSPLVSRHSITSSFSPPVLNWDTDFAWEAADKRRCPLLPALL